MDYSNAVNIGKDRENGPLPKLRRCPGKWETAMFFTVVTKSPRF